LYSTGHNFRLTTAVGWLKRYFNIAILQLDYGYIVEVMHAQLLNVNAKSQIVEIVDSWGSGGRNVYI
jgi:hypothetical protein